MNTSYYKYCGDHLTSEIAAEFIFKTYCSGKVSEPRICKELFEHHKKGGGLGPAGRLFDELPEWTADEVQLFANLMDASNGNEMKQKFYENEIIAIVRRGLRILKANKCAVEIQEERRTWWIRERDNQSNTTEIIGCGRESVYVYYFKSERDIKVLSVPEWKSHVGIFYPCNIGMAESSDPIPRVEQKTKDAPTPPVIALIIQTDQGRLLELIIQRILRYNDRECKAAKRTDWYYTTPEEVKALYKKVLL